MADLTHAPAVTIADDSITTGKLNPAAFVTTSENPLSNNNNSSFLSTASSIDLIEDFTDGNLVPDQTGEAGKFLTTDGTDASWATLSGGGDMAVATYDPTGVGLDAFDLKNHTATGTVDLNGQNLDAVNDIQAANVSSVSGNAGVSLDDDQIDVVAVDKIVLNSLADDYSFEPTHLPPDRAAETRSMIVVDTTTGKILKESVPGEGDRVIDTQPDVDLTANGTLVNDVVAGEAITVFPLSVKRTASGWEMTNATTEADSKGSLGVAMSTATVGNALTVYLPGSYVRDDSFTFAVDDTIFLNTTDGSWTNTAPTGTGQVVRRIGTCIATGIVHFDPSPDYIVLA